MSFPDTNIRRFDFSQSIMKSTTKFPIKLIRRHLWWIFPVFDVMWRLKLLKYFLSNEDTTILFCFWFLEISSLFRVYKVLQYLQADSSLLYFKEFGTFCDTLCLRLFQNVYVFTDLFFEQILQMVYKYFFSKIIKTQQKS